MTLTRGARLGPYEILEPIGVGGMGEVHRARHLKLGRDVAIKVLPAELADDRERLARFEREARTASALNHPNIVTIHDIAEDAGTTYIAMELVEGRTVRELLAEGPLPVDRALVIAAQVARGLARAHQAGIVHRDVKPANLMVTPDGIVKILDFGLARPTSTDEVLDPRAAGPAAGMTGSLIVGTPHYMSPEQLSGEPIDHRADQFAFGVTLYEMIAGRRPFDGGSLAAVMSAILTQPVPPLRGERRSAPRSLERVIARCLEKDPARRFGSMAEVEDRVRVCARRHARSTALRRPAVAGPIAAAVLALGAAGFIYARGADARWAENEAVAEITQLIDSGELYDAYSLALEAERYRPDDPELVRLFERITLPMEVNTEPQGAQVLVAGYGDADPQWQPLGVTPVTLRVPYAAIHWRIAKEGYEPFEGAPFSPGSIRALAQGIVLDSVGTIASDLVRVPGGPLEGPALIRPTRFLGGTMVDSYYFERFEVTNRQFRDFVDASGYSNPEWWPAFDRAGEEVPWEEAIAAFTDATGRPGPSTWVSGSYPTGEDEYPVSGISWFEAAAYCAFVGRSLPTVYHWFRAIGQEQRSDILLHSNMDGTEKAPVGAHRGISAFGAYDMAGNVKEWTWNATGDRRYILGGSWNEPTYLFKHLVGQDPWNREATNGVRCAHYPEPPPDHLTAPVSPPDAYPRPDPISDEAFELLRALYSYDRDSLDARVERVTDLPAYRREVVSLRTAYGDDRMDVHLLIPKNGEPPWQSVLWYPGDDVFKLRSSESFSSAWIFDWLPSTGRVLVYPIYRGMYERFEPWQRTPSDWRDMVISWSQDIGRTIDYLETRSDFDVSKIGYYGFSAGAIYAPVFTAVEPRIAVSMFIGGGRIPIPMHPAMDPVHFAPRSHVPTLMINGEDDFLMPYEQSQVPFFELLGAPENMKRHARLAGGHIPLHPREIMREITDWLDRHLGPVDRQAPIAVSRAGR